MLLFRSKRPIPVVPPVSPDEVKAFLPASVREPDRSMILTAQLDIADPSSDEDLRFLESLVQSVDNAPQPAATETRRPSQIATEPSAGQRSDAALELFRDIKPDRSEQDRRPLTVPDVDMDDLIEELSTTAAALRLRKAA